MQQHRNQGWQSKLLKSRFPFATRSVRPADVADALVSAMLARDNMIEDANYRKVVPNRFIVELSPDNYTRNYQTIENRVIKQWSERLLEQIMTANSRQGRREYYFGGRVQIEVRPVEGVQDAEARILWRVQTEGPGGPEPDQEGFACLEMTPEGRRWVLRPGTLTLGRDESCDIALSTPLIKEKRLISSQHAYIVSEEGKYRLFDGSLNGKPSLNGTFVNFQRVLPEGRLLQHGDTIILATPVPEHPQPGAPGSVTFRFYLGCKE